MARTFSDGTEGQPGAAPESTLASGIAIGATSLSVQAGHGARFPASGTFSVRIEDVSNPAHFEIVDCSSRSTDTLTIGATTFAWDSGDKVFHVIAKSDLEGFVQDAGDETIAGIKTFSSIPLGPASDPSTDNQLSRKKYVDDGLALKQALSDAAPITLSAPVLNAMSGAPTLSYMDASGGWADTRIPVWLMDDTTYENVAGTFVVPPQWATVNIVLWWGNPTAGAGDVIFRCFSEGFTDGETLDTTNDDQTNNTIAAPVQYAIKKSTLKSGLSVTAGALFRVMIQRRGGDAGDTKAGDIALLSVEIRRAS